MNIQEREEFDYQMGAASDLQNAFALSHMEWQRVNHSRDIEEALACGKIVLVHEWTSYCPLTDAILGGNIEMVQTFDPGQELPDVEVHEDDIRVYFRYPQPAPVVSKPLSDDEIPF